MTTTKARDLQNTDALLKCMLALSRSFHHVLETRAIEAPDRRLSKSKTEILRLLHEHGQKNATQLARYLNVSKPSITQTMDALVESHLVRKRSTRNDRRHVVLELTDKGKMISKQLRDEQRLIVRNAVLKSQRADVSRWIEVLQQITVALMESNQHFQDFCIQCGALADGSCLLEGGKAVCLFPLDSAEEPSTD